MLDAGITIDFNLSPPTRVPVRACRGAGEGAQARAGRGRSARQPRSDRRLCRGAAPARSRGRELSKTLAAADAQISRPKAFADPFAVADGRIIHNAGGSEAQELAFAVAAAVAYLRALEAGGVALDAGARA